MYVGSLGGGTVCVVGYLSYEVRELVALVDATPLGSRALELHERHVFASHRRLMERRTRGNGGGAGAAAAASGGHHH